jgi:hypothetical protein
MPLRPDEKLEVMEMIKDAISKIKFPEPKVKVIEKIVEVPEKKSKK